MGIVTTIAPIALALIMLGLGASLTVKDFTRVASNPSVSFPMEAKDGIVSYGKEIEEEMSSFLQSELEKYTTMNKIFRCLV